MNIYLIAYIILNAIGLGMSFATHGKGRSPQNGWHALLAFIINQSLVWAIYLTA